MGARGTQAQPLSSSRAAGWCKLTSSSIIPARKRSWSTSSGNRLLLAGPEPTATLGVHPPQNAGALEQGKGPQHRSCLWESGAAAGYPSFPGGPVVKNPPAKQETVWPDLEDPPEEDTATPPVSLSGESRGQNSLAGAAQGIRRIRHALLSAQ